MKNNSSPSVFPASGCSPDLTRFLDPQFFKALCDPSRLAIFGRLAMCAGPVTVSDITAGGARDISVVSRHLARLRRVGIVSSEKKGKEVYYRVRAGGVARFLRDLADALEQCCPEEMSDGEAHRIRRK